MKILTPFLLILLFTACARGKETVYIGSTPADPVIRSFLGIPQLDSIDFIRWRFAISDSVYKLECNYGICKPNTNGFIHGGSKIDLNGKFRKQNNYYIFQYQNRILKAIELNKNLFHLLDANNELLIGNGGWSYTLNNITPAETNELSLKSQAFALKDSIVFIGRTPCKIPGLIESGKPCYKLKWKLVLYAGQPDGISGRFKINGTPWRLEKAIEGEWKILSGENGRVSYVLTYSDKKSPLYLLKIDAHILVFTDPDGNLLIGDEDFSYTLNYGQK